MARRFSLGASIEWRSFAVGILVGTLLTAIVIRLLPDRSWDLAKQVAARQNEVVVSRAISELEASNIVRKPQIIVGEQRALLAFGEVDDLTNLNDEALKTIYLKIFEIMQRDVPYSNGYALSLNLYVPEDTAMRSKNKTVTISLDPNTKRVNIVPGH